MRKIFTCFYGVILLICFSRPVYAQDQDRIKVIESQLSALSQQAPGLKQKVQLLVTGLPMRDYLNALARATNINISADPSLTGPVYDTFNGVTAAEIIAFLAYKYTLEVNITGSIILISPFHPPINTLPAVPKVVNAAFDGSTGSLSLELNNDSLGAVARRITAVSGRNVIVPVALQGKTVSGFIAAAPFDAALEKLAYVNNIKITRTPDGFYVFQSLDENEETYVNGDRNTSTRRMLRPAQGPSQSSGVFARKVGDKKLLSADANNAPIDDMIRRASAEMNKNFVLYTELKGNISIHVSDVSYESFLSMLLKNTEYSYRQDEGIYLIGDRKVTGVGTFKMVKLKRRAVDSTLMRSLPAELTIGLQVQPFRELNSILLSGSAMRVAAVESVIRQLDELVPVVLIELTMIDVHKNRTVATGISAGVSDSVKTGGTVLPGINYTFGSKSINSFLNSMTKFTSLNLGHVTPNFYASISALESQGNVEVRSVPKLSSLNGHQASFSVGKKAYYKDVTQSVIPSLNNPTSYFTNIYKEVNADLSVNINPVVSDNDQVTLSIKINISDFLSIPTDGSPPPQSVSKYETNLRVKSEDTILLGGIERTEDNESASGVPLLSRIPVLKWLFSSRTKTNDKVVTLLLIKSTIIR
ncbi:type II and III secretion system protein [Mucilaginibacter sp. 14171R-50]|uniref:type II secretion system protein GspD n=1 Tax=Mucilaginibacter sp. 14171R-50 TaxID=2703789 RepID=UPI00138B1D80|nr:type II and III secretion system protein [Mucilaginibacter sp. 14171R-50]QHS56505.1 type II and III secretion system protein [Mucilaginibacter sp. 14171R-50]